MSGKGIHFVSTQDFVTWGGSEELWALTALELSKRNECISSNTRYWPAEKRHPRLAELANKGVAATFRVVPVTFASRLFHRAGRALKIARDPFHVGSRELVVFSSGCTSFPASPINFCIEKRIPYALIVQSVQEVSWPKDGALKQMRHIYGHAERVYFVSKANLECVRFQIGLEGENFRKAHNPFNVPWGQSFEWPFSTEGPVEIAMVARLDPQHKGQDLLFQVLARDSWKNRDLVVNLYGAGFSEQGLRRMVEMLGIQDKVRFQGHVPDVQEIWKKNQLLVLPSRHEGLPLALVEAMLCGRAGLVTNVSGNPEYIQDGVNGFLAAGATVDAVDAALQEAWAKREHWAAMGEAAHRHIRTCVPEDPAQVFADELLEVRDLRRAKN